MDKIELCKKCTKRYFDMQQGIVCGLTQQKPEFEEECQSFEKDETITEYKGDELRPNEQRAKVLITLIWIVLGLEVVSIISSAMQYNLLQAINDGGNVSMEDAGANDLRENIVSWVYFIFFIASSISFVMWFRRAYFNLHQKVENLSYSEGWAAGYWIVPILNTYRPYKIMEEIYKETRKLLLNAGLISHEELKTRLLSFWWGLWIFSAVIGSIINKHPNETLDDVVSVTLINIFLSVIGIPLALVTLKVVKDYSKVESLLQRIKE